VEICLDENTMMNEKKLYDIILVYMEDFKYVNAL
jgi:hypothetical protein